MQSSMRRINNQLSRTEAYCLGQLIGFGYQSADLVAKTKHVAVSFSPSHDCSICTAAVTLAVWYECMEKENGKMGSIQCF